MFLTELPQLKQLKWWGLGVLAGVAAACAPSPQPTTAPAEPAAPAAPAPAEPQPKYGGVLNFSPTTAPASLHPYAAAGPTIEEALGSVYEPLLSWRHDPGTDYRRNYEVVPWLVERWQQADPATYVLHLRKGVKWHDGVEFTAADVEFSLNYAIDKGNAFPIRTLNFINVDSAQAVDRYTARVTSKGPVPGFLNALAERGSYILPKHVFDRGDDFRKVVVGTGPFKLKEFDPNSATTTVRNPDYWQSGRPYLDGIRILYGLAAQHQEASFIAGQLDIHHLNDRKQLETIKRAMPGLQHGAAAINHGLSIIPKLSKRPFDDVRVRRAIHLAVDRQGLNAAGLFGDGIINPPGMPGDKEGWAIPQEELLKLPGYRQPKDQDIAEAKRLLAEAGYAAGLKTNLLLRNVVVYVRFAEPLQAQLAKAGIDVTLQPLPVAEVTAQENKGAFDLTQNNVAGQDYRYKNQLTWLYSKNSPPNDIDDKALDELLERATRQADVNEQKRAVLEMQRYLLEKLYVIPVLGGFSYPMWQAWTHDFVWEPSNVVRISPSQAYRVWIDVEKLPADRRRQ